MHAKMEMYNVYFCIICLHKIKGYKFIDHFRKINSLALFIFLEGWCHHWMSTKTKFNDRARISWYGEIVYTHSPNNSTAVTDTTMAVMGSETRSRQRGMDSTAAALASSRVTSNKWWRLTTGKILLAYFFSFAEPASSNTFSVIISIDNMPSVSPDTKPVGAKCVNI